VTPRAERVQRFFEWPVVISALLVLPAIAIEQSSLDEPWDTLAVVINWSTWFVFLAELVAMLVVVPNRKQWLRTHPLELPLVVLTPPILPPGLQALRALRVLRVLRLLRVASFSRRAFSLEGLRFATVIAALAALGGGAAFEALERNQTPRPDLFDGIWWAMSTMTTVGYGDVYPMTTGGRLLAILLMMIGIGFVALVTGSVAERFISPSVTHLELGVEAVENEDQLIVGEIREIRRRLEHLEALLQRSS
jgi:voltage-gated potassium channel